MMIYKKKEGKSYRVESSIIRGLKMKYETFLVLDFKSAFE